MTSSSATRTRCDRRAGLPEAGGLAASDVATTGVPPGSRSGVSDSAIVTSPDWCACASSLLADDRSVYTRRGWERHARARPPGSPRHVLLVVVSDAAVVVVDDDAPELVSTTTTYVPLPPSAVIVTLPEYEPPNPMLPTNALPIPSDRGFFTVSDELFR